MIFGLDIVSITVLLFLNLLQDLDVSKAGATITVFICNGIIELI